MSGLINRQGQGEEMSIFSEKDMKDAYVPTIRQNVDLFLRCTSNDTQKSTKSEPQQERFRPETQTMSLTKVFIAVQNHQSTY